MAGTMTSPATTSHQRCGCSSLIGTGEWQPTARPGSLAADGLGDGDLGGGVGPARSPMAVSARWSRVVGSQVIGWAEFLVTVDATWIPSDVDPDQPSVARIYDYLLGGARNFAVDRQLAEQIMAMVPESRDLARLNRAFLRRAVLFMVSAGMRQFLDIGSGIPTVGNVHELVQRTDPEARVVYVDIEPIAVQHSMLMLEGNDRATAIQADLTDPESILGHCETRRLLDFDQPIGLLLVGVLHFVPYEWDLNPIVARYRDALVPGSHVAMTHIASEVTRPDMAAEALDVAKSQQVMHYPRSREQFITFFDGLELVEPGVVSQPLWRPESQTDLADPSYRDQVIVGVGRKP